MFYPDMELPPLPSQPGQVHEGGGGHTTSAMALQSHQEDLNGQATRLLAGDLPWMGHASNTFKQRQTQVNGKIGQTQQGVGSAGSTMQGYASEVQMTQQTGAMQMNEANMQMQRANMQRQEAEDQVYAAQMQLEAAYAELAAATAEAAATLGVGSPAVAAAEAQVVESQAQLAEAQAQRAAAIAAQQEARGQQEQVFTTTQQRYQQSSEDFAGSLNGAQAPLDALATNGTNPLVDSGNPLSGRSTFVPGAQAVPGAALSALQSTQTTCGANAAVNVASTFGSPMSEVQAVGMTGNAIAGTSMDGIASGLNQQFAQNPGTLGNYVSPDLLASGQTFAARSNVSLDVLTQATSGGVPAVVSIRNPAGGLHAVTVDGIQNGLVTYRDPLTGLTYRAPVANFQQVWNGGAVMLSSVPV